MLEHQNIRDRHELLYYDSVSADHEHIHKGVHLFDRAVWWSLLLHLPQQKICQGSGTIFISHDKFHDFKIYSFSDGQILLKSWLLVFEPHTKIESE